MATPITLILGGARSGKSNYAEQLAMAAGSRVLYIATAEAGDEEMAARIVAHRQSRPASWLTLEAARRLDTALPPLDFSPEVMLLDCLTLLVSNIVLDMEAEPQASIESTVTGQLDALIAAQLRFDVPLIIVSNEVGLGVVPPYRLGRIYRDVLGRTNQNLANRADSVILMVAGLPVTVKKNRGEK